MKFYHATPKANLESIEENGLLVSKAKKKDKFVWLHTSSRSHWAIIHTCKNHKVDWDEVAIIEVEVPRTWLKSHKLTILGKGLNGFWKCDKDISPEHFSGVLNSEDYA